jgi:hypothetical protein
MNDDDEPIKFPIEFKKASRTPTFKKKSKEANKLSMITQAQID